jgi:2',3'-cyclic-nucleotide 2'-phosphodiesterase (5'-nucleotidase family)
MISFIYLSHNIQMIFGPSSPRLVLMDLYPYGNIFCGAKMKMKATIDRFEVDKAVLIVGENRDEYIIPRASLPHGVVQGLWLLVEIEDNRITNVAIDEEETAKVKEKLAEKIARLKHGERRQ